MRAGLRSGRLGTTVAAVVWLAAVWVLLWGTLSWANVIAGVAVALLVRWALPLPPVVPEGRLRLLPSLHLVAIVAGQLVVSSLQVARLAVRPGPPPRTAVVAVQLQTESDLVLALVALVVTLVPGSMVVEIDQTRRLLYSHTIDCDEDGGAAQHRAQVRQLEDLMTRALPTSTRSDVTVVAEEQR